MSGMLVRILTLSCGALLALARCLLGLTEALLDFPLGHVDKKLISSNSEGTVTKQNKERENKLKIRKTSDEDKERFGIRNPLLS